MTETSIPHTGKTTGDAGPYSSSEWARIWRTLFQGLQRDDASVVFGTGNGTDEALWVEETAPASTQVQVNIGNGLVKGYWYQTDAIVNIQISSNTDASGDDRIDLVILRLDVTNQDVRLEILEGTVAPVPVVPSVTQNATIWEVPIATIAVANSFSSIVNANIDNTVREYAIVTPIKHGGTGISQVPTQRQILEGDISSEYALHTISGASWGISGDSATYAAAAWDDTSVGTGSIDELYDPDNLITVGSDGVTVAEAGLYRMSFVGRINNGSVASRDFYFRLYNATQMVGSAIISHPFSLGASTALNMVNGEGLIEADAGDEIRLQCYSAGGTNTFFDDQVGGSGGGTPHGITTRSVVFYIEKVAGNT